MVVVCKWWRELDVYGVGHTGKDLTIQKLQLQLAMKDKLIEQQRGILHVSTGSSARVVVTLGLL